MDRYDANTIEEKWQRIWEDARAFYVSNPEPGAADEPHWYQLEMLPYPSGILHMGHVLNYTMGDVVTHFRRRHGWRVLRRRTPRSTTASIRARAPSGTSSTSARR